MRISRGLLFAGLIGCVFLGAGGIIASTAINAFTSTDKFCTSCHSQLFQFTDLHFQNSAHQNNSQGIRPSCGNCHIPTTNWFIETYTHVTSGIGFTPQSGSWFYSPAYRQFMFDNRERTTADFAIDVAAFRGVTVSPTLKFKNDYYGLNPLNEEGLTDNRSISAGVDVGFVVSPKLSFAFSYYWEDYNQQFYSNTSNQTPTAGQGLIINSDRALVNTWTAAVHWATIPDKLNVDLRYAISDGVEKQACSACVATVNGSSGPPTPVFPNITTSLQRLDATAAYKFDPTFVSQIGFRGIS
jgi:hypothetical protein